MVSDLFTRWRYKLVPDKIVGEILSTSCVDNAIPFLFLLIALGVFGAVLPRMFTAGSMSGMTRTAGEYLLVALAALAHFVLTRLRPGWHILAVGGSRRVAPVWAAGAGRCSRPCWV